VVVSETGGVFVSVGQAEPQIATSVGWLPQNVWLPERELDRIRRKHQVFPDTIAAARMLLTRPTSAHRDRHLADAVYLVTSGELLRQAGLLTSRTTRFVDAVVDFRRAGAAGYLRLFHLGPSNRNKGGAQLWP